MCKKSCISLERIKKNLIEKILTMSLQVNGIESTAGMTRFQNVSLVHC